MRRRTAPFGNDLQDDFDVKLVNGRIVQISKYLPEETVKKTQKDEEHQKNTSSKQQATVKTGYHDNKSTGKKYKLPPIQPAAIKPHSKTNFHSAPPKLMSSKWNSSGKPAELNPLLHGTECKISDSLVMLNSQLLAIQRKRPNTLEDIEGSCRRLDAFRSGSISLQELVDILYINGISINPDTLREFCGHNNLDITDGDQVSYRDFMSKMSTSSSWSNHRDNVSSCQQVSAPRNSRNILEMEERIENQNLQSFHKETKISDLSNDNNHRMIVSCPERVSMAATCDNNIDNNGGPLLDDLQDCFSGTRWGNHGDVHRLESRLAMADKHHQGLLPASVVSASMQFCKYMLSRVHNILLIL